MTTLYHYGLPRTSVVLGMHMRIVRRIMEGGAQVMVRVNCRNSQKMIAWVVAVVVLVIVAYATYLLFFNLDPEKETRLEDFLHSKQTFDGKIAS